MVQNHPPDSYRDCASTPPIHFVAGGEMTPPELTKNQSGKQKENKALIIQLDETQKLSILESLQLAVIKNKNISCAFGSIDVKLIDLGL